MWIETEGSGPALVLLHGWAMHGGIFRPLSDRLREHFTLYRVDLPGHGHSASGGDGMQEGRLDADATLEQLRTELPVAPWLGWSLGGLLAIHAAARWPQRVPALIALCASPRFVRGEDWPHAVDAAVFQGFGLDLGRDYRQTIDRFLALEAHGSDHMREELRELRAHVFERGEPATHVLCDGLALLDRLDARALLPQLAVPSLWIAGRRDRLVPWQGMQQAATSSPGGIFRRIEGGGHAPFLSHADEVAAAIRAFLLPAATG